MRRLVAVILPVVALVAVLAAPASDAQAERKWSGRGFHGGHYRQLAQGGRVRSRGRGYRGGRRHFRPRGHARWRGRGYYGRHYGYYRYYGRARWRGGYWRHGWYGRRLAWWWIVGGFWYPYPAPIYPYPVYVPAAPPVYSGPPPTQYWYFCSNPRGYYPYVTSCRVAWRPVPVTPPAAPRRRTR